jgi:hypothetical protein
MWKRPRWRTALGLPVLILPLVTAAAVDGGNPAGASFAIGLTDRPWRVLIDLPGFQMGPIERREGGARSLGATEDRTWVVSLTLAVSPEDPSPRSCRDRDWAGRQRAPFEREDTRLTEQGDRARVEYTVPRIDGVTAQQKNVLLYLQHDGVCVAVHLSRALYRPDDAALVERILGSTRVAD